MHLLMHVVVDELVFVLQVIDAANDALVLVIIQVLGYVLVNTYLYLHREAFSSYKAALSEMKSLSCVNQWTRRAAV